MGWRGMRLLSPRWVCKRNYSYCRWSGNDTILISPESQAVVDINFPCNTINSGVQVHVLLFEDCAFSCCRLHGVLLEEVKMR